MSEGNLSNKPTPCALCGRVLPLTFHHLIPKMVHRRRYFKKNLSREALNQGIDICRPCHSHLHNLYDEMTLGKELNSLEALRTDEAIQKHIKWLRKQRRL